MSDSTFEQAVTRLARPLIRLLIRRGMTLPQLVDLLKKLYVSEAENTLNAQGARLTDSRVSVLTGLQRKDVKAIRSVIHSDQLDRQGGGMLARLLARWQGEDRWPRTLPRKGDGGISFEELCSKISRDVHPRTMLDELIRLGLVSFDPKKDHVILDASGFVPVRDDAALVGYLGANLGDHAEAAVGNVLGAPEPARFFERAVHYNRLSPASVRALDDEAREIQEQALLRLNSMALSLQKRDDGLEDARARFRCGAFIYHSLDDDAA